MTVEELEILVEASIQPAIEEFKKSLPQIKKQMAQIVDTVEKTMSQTNLKGITAKVNQAVQMIKKRIDNFKKSNKNNEIAINVNNKEAQKQISQVEKEIESLQKKISARQMKLDVINPQIDQIVSNTRNEVVPEGIDKNSPVMDSVINNALSSNKDFTSLNSQAQKLYTEIELYNRQLEEAKAKMAQLKHETAQTATTQKKLSSFFNAFKGKLDQAKVSIGGMKNNFNQIPKVTQKITNNIKQMGKGMKQGLGNVLRYAGALFSLQTIYSTLSGAANSWLSSQNAQAKQLSANIEYMKYAMGSALAPVIQNITNLIYQLMKAVQSLVYAFSGINIFAKATASSMNSTASSAKKASKSLSSVHSEINNVSTNDDSSGSGSVSPSMDLTKIDTSLVDWIDNIKERISTLFEPIRNSWNTYGQPLMDSIKYAFNSNLELIKTIGKSFKEVWLNGTGEQTCNTILQILTLIFNTCGNINKAFKEAWKNNSGTEIIQNLWGGLNNLLGIIKGIAKVFEDWTSSESFQVFANSIIQIFNTLSSWFEIITQKLKEIWDNGGSYALNSLLEVISKIVEFVRVILDILSPVVEFILNIVTPIISEIVQAIGFLIDALGGLLDFIIGVFTGDWERAWQGICDFFTGIWNALKTIVETIWNAIKKFFSDIWEGIKNIATTIWTSIANFFSNIWEGIKNTATNIWNGIKTTISNVINGIKNTISSVFNGIKNTISNIWNSIVNTISNVWNTITNKVKEGVSGAWKAITSVFGNIANWFKEQFSNAWQAVKNVFSAGGEIFNGIKDGILNGLKSVINAIIRGINKVISIPFNGINTALRAIRNVNILGLQPFSWIKTISVPQIPTLAKGGVLYDERLVMAGEYSGARQNPEIVTPQNIMYDTMLKALGNIDFGNNQDTPIQLTVIVGNEKLGQILLNDLRSKKRQTGKNLEALVGG